MTGCQSRNMLGIIALMGLAFALFCSCNKSRQNIGQPRLVILYATCTVNKDFLSPYNKDIRFTPNIERFAKSSIVFTKHITEAGQSGPSYASIFSGVQANKHGVYRHPTMLSEDLYLISEAFSDNGYETFFWNAHKMASKELNYGQGIDWENTFDYMLWGEAPEFLEILQKLKNDKNYKAFVMANFTVTHGPYNGNKLESFINQYPEEANDLTSQDIVRYNRLYQENCLELQWNFPETVERLKLSPKDVLKLSQVVELLYKKNIRLLDYLFGKVLEPIEKFGLLDDSLIVFTADHGEILYRENALFKWTHGKQLAPEVLNVPLIIFCPESNAKTGYYNKITRSIDVFPTMIGLSNLSKKRLSDVDGADLSNAIMGKEPSPALMAYSHTCVANQYVFEQMKDWTLAYTITPRVDVNLIWVSIIQEDRIFKLKSLDGTNWTTEVFDLENDPIETKNLYDPTLGKMIEMEKELRHYKKTLVSNYNQYIHAKSKELRRPVPKEDQIEALKSLGYIK